MGRSAQVDSLKKQIHEREGHIGVLKREIEGYVETIDIMDKRIAELEEKLAKSEKRDELVGELVANVVTRAVDLIDGDGIDDSDLFDTLRYAVEELRSQVMEEDNA